ncbi:MAG: hypothetical protein GC136_06775 [Alphaproteobacteria bacterium]|nr:hypothetical protein [Alphaproteobacteria bacterium]
MDKKQDYDEFEHRHRFAAWAAARAAQRGLLGGTNKNLINALGGCNIKEFVRNPSRDLYERDHDKWCDSILNEIRFMAYGRAAKLIAVYLKVMLILDPGVPSEITDVIHPPIDSVLLINIKKIKGFESFKYSKAKWTGLDKIEYQEIIEDLKKLKGDMPFWKIEQAWDPKES